MMSAPRPRPAPYPTTAPSRPQAGLPPLAIQKLTPEQQTIARDRANAPAPVVTGQERTLLPMAPGVVPQGQQAPRLSAQPLGGPVRQQMPRDPYADLQQAVSALRGSPPNAATPTRPSVSGTTQSPMSPEAWQRAKMAFTQMPTDMGGGISAIGQALMNRQRQNGAFPVPPGGSTPAKFLNGLFRFGKGGLT